MPSATLSRTSIAIATRRSWGSAQCCPCATLKPTPALASPAPARKFGTTRPRLETADDATRSAARIDADDHAHRHSVPLSSGKQGAYQQWLASTSAQWRSALASRTAELSTEAKARLALLNSRVNEATGYEEVERLKGKVLERENVLSHSRERAKASKVAYDSAVAARSVAQQDVNSLLERKHSWTEDDVSRFTKLVRSDHTSSAAVIATSEHLKEAEAAVDKAFSDLTQAILERYHEEQVWSDRIRNISTYAGIAGLVINLVVFVGAIAVVEPWKRRRLVERLEERLAGMMSAVEQKIQQLSEQVVPVVEPLDLAASDAAVPGNLEGAASEGITVTTSHIDHVFGRLEPLLTPIAARSPDRDAAVILFVGGCVGVTLVSLVASFLR